MDILLTLRVLFLFLILSIFLYLYTYKFEKNIRAIVIGSFFLRVAATLFVNLFPVIPYTRDYQKYQVAIDSIITGWSSGIILPVTPAGVVNSYSYFVAPVYIVAPSTMAVELLNGLLGALVVCNVYRISSEIYGPSKASLTALLAAIYPSFVHYTSILMRDSLIIFISSQIVVVLVDWISRDKKPHQLVPLVLAAVLLRPENLAYILPTVSLVAFLKIGTSVSLKQKIAIGAAISFIGGILFAIALLAFPGEIPTPSPDSLSARRAWLARGTGDIGGNYLSSVRFDSWLDIIVFAPIGAAYFLLVPLPWMVNLSNPFVVVAFLENLFLLYPCTVVLLLRLKQSGKFDKTELVLLIMFVFGVVSYGLVEGNMGPAMRHRLQFTYLLFILTTPLLPVVTPFPASNIEILSYRAGSNE